MLNCCVQQKELSKLHAYVVVLINVINFRSVSIAWRSHVDFFRLFYHCLKESSWFIDFRESDLLCNRTSKITDSILNAAVIIFTSTVKLEDCLQMFHVFCWTYILLVATCSCKLQKMLFLYSSVIHKKMDFSNFEGSKFWGCIRRLVYLQRAHLKVLSF